MPAATKRPTPAQVAARQAVAAKLADEGYDDDDLDSPAGLRTALRQLQIEGERLTSLEQDLRSTLDSADEDAEDEAQPA